MADLEQKIEGLRVPELEGKELVLKDYDFKAVLAEAERRGHQPRLFYQLINAGVHGYLSLTNFAIITSEIHKNRISYSLYVHKTRT